MGMMAARHTDPIVGLDMHMIQPPAPAPPVMVPHPMAGMVMDPSDYSPGACTVYINGLPRARAGNVCMMSPPHAPMGGMFVKPPLNEAELYQGSSTVTADGEALSAMSHQVLGCHDIGAPAPVRRWKSGGAKSLMKAGSVVLPIAGGLPVMVGGAPTTAARGSAERVDLPRTLELRFYDAESGQGVEGLTFEIELAGGEVVSATTNAEGVIRLDDLPSQPNSAVICHRLPDEATVDTTWQWLSRTPLCAESNQIILHDHAPRAGERRHLAVVARHRISERETLDSIARLHRIDRDRLARFNFGTAESSQVQDRLRAHLGCLRTDERGECVFTGGECPGLLFVPRPLAHLVLLDNTYEFPLVAATRTVERLETSLPLDHLRALLEQLGETAFILWAARVFGADVGIEAYRRLIDDLNNDILAMPPVQLVVSDVDGHLGAYDSRVGSIQVARHLAREAERSVRSAWVLAAVLLEEFGHHIDQLLRFHYSDIGGDAPGDEGARFAFNAVQMDWRDGRSAPFATYERDGESISLELDWSGLRAHAEPLVGEAEQRDDGRSGSREYFGAGRGNTARRGHSFGHRSIEDELESAGFGPAERDAVYYGNWLRDFSQVVTERTIRPVGDQPFQRGPGNIFTRETITRVVNQLGYAEFHPYPPAGSAALSRQMLGVYRCEEHIDNPDGLIDGRAIDPALRGPVSREELGIDPNHLMKRYIRSSGAQWTSALDYVKSELRQAVAEGRTSEGFRRLGQALHTLEDFYAHSNFCELALIEAGHPVFPWTGGIIQGVYPLVTGKFGGVDTCASILLAIAEFLGRASEQCMDFGQLLRGRVLQPNIAVRRGLRVAEILIVDVMPQQRDLVAALVRDGERFVVESPALAWVACNLVGRASEFFRNSIGFAIHGLASQIDEAETMFVDDTESTNPTHSQIAKDHDDHPLHAPAARAAQIAVRHVAEAVNEAWSAHFTVEQVEEIASHFFVHPHRITNSSHMGVREIRESIATWAGGNASALSALPSRDDVSRLRQWGHSVAEHAGALQRDPSGYINERIHELDELRQQIEGDGQESAKSMMRDLQRLYRAVLGDR